MDREKAASLEERGRMLLDQEGYAQAEEFFVQEKIAAVPVDVREELQKVLAVSKG
ncbi:MAG: hypothetical protein KGZ63_00475 [Clostridiales bacterium]|jgi:hypothetical protein|nr:hypothetical protein [Clostridiales bacterium]